jgi:signal transduction histidine kinase
VGVTLLFGIALKNGTLEAITARLVKLCGHRTAILPLVFFFLSFALGAMGPGSIAATAIVAPLAMSAGLSARLPAFLLALMVSIGANAGTLSPISVTGIISVTQMERAGLIGYGANVFAAGFAAHMMVATVAYLLFGGSKLWRAHRDAATPPVHIPPMTAKHWSTVAVLLVWFGLTRGLAPLAFLQARIRARKPDDLSPIDPSAAPDEISPLVVSFNELLARQAQSLQTQQRFLADAAHQMKTPLAGLRTQAELAMRETDPQELRRTLRHIARSTERATHLANQLLALARAEHHASSPGAFQVINLTPLAIEVVRDHVPDAIARSLDLGFEGVEEPVRIVAAPLLVQELLRNLVDNALRYTPANGTITVRVRKDGDSAFLEVEDNGPGIPEAERQRVFDRFYRILGTNVDGSGLGLAIVREIAAQHEALVRLSANPSAAENGPPGILISVEFQALAIEQPNLDVGSAPTG